VTLARSLVPVALLVAGACVDADVRLIGPARPSRPPACAVELVPVGPPPYDVVDVASVNVSCAKTRERCLDELRKDACVVGADTIYGFSERSESIYIHMTVTLAARR
jgi:hypothetical protein